LKYYNKIDGLRFFAIFLVLIAHFAPFFGSKFSAAYYGVDLFFVISGFLITGILLKSKAPTFWDSYKNFIGRRTLRIFPIYYLTVLILLFVGLPVVKNNLVYVLTYSFNYAQVFLKLPPNPINHFWSLCVEEQFYLFWPFIILFLKDKNRNYLNFLILSIIIIGFSQMTLSWIPGLSEYNYTGLLTRMGSLGFGALGAILFNSNKLPSKIFESKIIEYVVLIILLFALIGPFKIKYLIMAICSFYFVLKSAHSDFKINIINKVLQNRIIIYIGSISYGIYVYHIPFSYYFTQYVFNPIWDSINFSPTGFSNQLYHHPWVVKFPLYTVLSILIASFSYKFIETPILKLKDRFFLMK
jgi:peptidoglycan/LPS O-acetylase OafA/YrhL